MQRETSFTDRLYNKQLIYGLQSERENWSIHFNRQTAPPTAFMRFIR